MAWRMAADYVLYGSPEGKQFSLTMQQHLVSKFDGASGRWNNLNTGCLVNNVFGDWSNNAFMYGPAFASLIVPGGSVSPQQALSAAAQKISSATINDYYAGSWVVIATLTLNGDLASAAARLLGTGGQSLRSASAVGGNSAGSFPLSAMISIPVVIGVVVIVAVILVVLLLISRRAKAQHGAVQLSEPLLRTSAPRSTTPNLSRRSAKRSSLHEVNVNE